MAFDCIKNDKKIYSFVYSLKDWIAKNEPQTLQEAHQGQQAIKEYKEQQKQQEPKIEQLKVRTIKNKNNDKGMER